MQYTVCFFNTFGERSITFNSAVRGNVLIYCEPAENHSAIHSRRDFTQDVFDRGSLVVAPLRSVRTNNEQIKALGWMLCFCRNGYLECILLCKSLNALLESFWIENSRQQNFDNNFNWWNYVRLCQHIFMQKSTPTASAQGFSFEKYRLNVIYTYRRDAPDPISRLKSLTSGLSLTSVLYCASIFLWYIHSPGPVDNVNVIRFHETITP